MLKNFHSHIKYGDLKEDLSNLDLHKFEQSLEKVALECFRVLKENKMCCIMIGDIRKNKEVYPLGFKLMSIFQSVGFNLKEIIIKEVLGKKPLDAQNVKKFKKVVELYRDDIIRKWIDFFVYNIDFSPEKITKKL